ncbi:shikimate kinase [Paenibacillus sp. GCM10012307]|uniref:Shikimate kinase n=1 Tax=Paenibacillus roseus TaxID=2798579 RepID=A0A934J3F7_9BACL|nr:shikimate kinase [Paenibacillus roseus]MBJ6359735.1 shikimate kinase [Paenibacillus roseus]
MKFVLIFGPQAVGKMTVGHELENITELKLFHNHVTIEMLHPYFGFSPESWRLSNLFRTEILEVSSSSEMYGMIFTYVWAFNIQSDWDFVNKICQIFESKGGDVYFIELEADLDTRLVRNHTPHRLEHKPTKRNLKQSEHDLKSSMDEYRLNSFENEITRENYIRINNTSLTAAQVAEMIKKQFFL